MDILSLGRRRAYKEEKTIRIKNDMELLEIGIK